MRTTWRSGKSLGCRRHATHYRTYQYFSGACSVSKILNIHSGISAAQATPYIYPHVQWVSAAWCTLNVYSCIKYISGLFHLVYVLRHWLSRSAAIKGSQCKRSAWSMWSLPAMPTWCEEMAVVSKVGICCILAAQGCSSHVLRIINTSSSTDVVQTGKKVMSILVCSYTQLRAFSSALLRLMIMLVRFLSSPRIKGVFGLPPVLYCTSATSTQQISEVSD